jgi:sulfite exporter TauE/SafE
MDFPEGIILGLGTGTICLAYCGPVLIPYLFGENRNIPTNFYYVFLFLTGRLAAYIAVGFIAGTAGTLFLQPSGLKILFIGISYIVLSVLLIIYGFYQFKEVCLGKTQTKFALKYAKNRPFLVPIIGGILTGVNICPPFILAITKAAAAHNIGDSILFFLLFFLGTSVYFIPLPFIGIFKRQQVLRIIGKFASILAGLLYLYKGVLMIIY